MTVINDATGALGLDPGATTKTKATDAEIMMRVYRIKQNILEGRQLHDILEHWAAEWSVTDRQIRRYVEQARESLRDEIDALGYTSLNWHLATRIKLFERCLDSADFGNARQVLADLGKLQDLYPSQNRHLDAIQAALEAVNKKLDIAEAARVINPDNTEIG